MANNKGPEDSNKKLLNKIYKGTRMGINSIDILMDKVEDKELLGELAKQKSAYGDISLSAENALAQMGIPTHEGNAIEKAQLWSGIQLNTIKDRDASHIAELLINGSTMGIIDMTRKLRQYNNGMLNAEVIGMANHLIEVEQGNIETLKGYL